MVASITTGLLAPHVGALATRIGPTWVVLAGAFAMLGSYLIFLATGANTSYPVILASLVLMGAGFALAYPALNIQALAGVRDDEQGLASGLVGSSFQIGGAVLLAVSTAATIAFTPAHAGANHSVHGLHAGMGVAVAGAGLMALIAASALLAQRRRSNYRIPALERAA
jgi:MFS family permease